MLREGFAAIRRELKVPTDFPEAALDEASGAVDSRTAGRADLTDLPFVTIDPPGRQDRKSVV